MQPSSPGFLTKLLAANARFIYRHSMVVSVVGLLFVAFCAWFAWNFLGFKTSSSDLIGADDEVHSRQLEYMAEFRSEEDFVILMESSDPVRNRLAVEALAAKLRSEPNLVNESGSNLLYKIDDSSLRSRGLLFMDARELTEIRDRLGEMQGLLGGSDTSVTIQQILNTVAERAAPDAASPAPASETAALDQLQFLSTLLQSIRSSLETPEGLAPGPEFLFAGAATRAEPSAYVGFNGDQSLLLLLSPIGKTASFTPFSNQIQRLREIVAETRVEFPDVHFGLTGETVLKNDEQTTYQKDTMVGLIFTIVVVFVIFAWAYRGIWRPILKIGVLICAIICALAFTAATVGHLNMLSVAFVVMILGLGDDFAIYVITRYEEERRRGLNAEDSMVASLEQAGHSVVMASLTIAISFSTMVFTGFKGLSEMGVIAAGGILICALLCLTLLPALLLLQKRERLSQPKEIRHIITPRLLQAERFWLRHAGWVVSLTFLLTLAAGLYVFRPLQIPAAIADWRSGGDPKKAFGRLLEIPFQYDLLDMQNASLESVTTVRHLNDLQSIYFAVVLADSLEETRTLQQELAALPTVGSVVSILGASDREASTLPEDQSTRLPLAQEVVKMAAEIQLQPSDQVDPAMVMESAASVASRFRRMSRLVLAMGETGLGDRMKEVTEAATRLEEQIAAMSPADAAKRLAVWQAGFGSMLESAMSNLAKMKVDRPVEIDDLPQTLQSRYIGKTGRFLLQVYPKHDLREKEALEAFCRDVLSVAPRAAGTPIELDKFVDLLKVSYLKAALYALIFVTALILFYFRRALPALLCLFPLFAGIVLMLGFMKMTGLAFNLANIITLPLIIGIGVDNGILILQRFRYEPDIELFSKNTGRAILMSNLSTLAGFVGLAFAQHQGIASLGMVMSIGVGMTMLVSLTTLPAMIHLLKKRRIAI